MRDEKSEMNFAQTLAPAARTASANGTGVDLRGYYAATFVIDAGAWTDGSHTPKAQESDDNSTFTDVAAADLNGSFTAITSGTQASQLYKVGYKGTKRYVRVATTVSGATTGAVYGAVVVRGEPQDAPAP